MSNRPSPARRPASTLTLENPRRARDMRCGSATRARALAEAGASTPAIAQVDLQLEFATPARGRLASARPAPRIGLPVRPVPLLDLAAPAGRDDRLPGAARARCPCRPPGAGRAAPSGARAVDAVATSCATCDRSATATRRGRSRGRPTRAARRCWCASTKASPPSRCTSISPGSMPTTSRCDCRSCAAGSWTRRPAAGATRCACRDRRGSRTAAPAHRDRCLEALARYGVEPADTPR